MSDSASPVSFIGAGPGDPELMTVKGKKRMNASDVIIWAGSLIHDDVLQFAPDDAEIVSSADMVLEETVDRIDRAVSDDEQVARLHSGDASIYGALREELEALEERGITCEVLPGVSSFTAAAASLQVEYTVPDVAQTVILTRKEGRTPVPDSEKLADLAKHRTSMCLFLSSARMDEVVEDLRTGYDEDTPVAVGHRVTWPDERWVSGTLDDIAEKVKEAGMNKTALILVGEFLRAAGKRSNLYDPSFSHGHRKARDV